MSEPRDMVAVLSMAGRFPGAADVASLWDLLRRGGEAISRFDDAVLAAAGVGEELRRDPSYVPVRGVVDGADLFDADFFGFHRREAEVTDPQHRVFLESAWRALEAGGYDPSRYAGAIGVFAGRGTNRYAYHLAAHPELVAAVGPLQVAIGNEPDHLAALVAYKLDLRGPAVAVQTACSTSLVAVHLACQSLLGGECDLALAGGVSITVPQPVGYRHQAGGILSRDGHCRPFDAAASGTVASSGAGVVLLKRLDRALADGDPVRAVIRGSAINNDGARKVGYTAPGVAGQAAVIAEALAVAEVEPETVGYVEAHGTGTELGDPIEVEALREAFGPPAGGEPCGLGSVKSNLGHLDAAAGVAGLIKAVCAVEAGELPPSLHYERPNPRIDFAATPFRVVDRLCPWPSRPGPRRAGVSSFGIGGTNAHVVLEEAPPPPPRRGEPRPLQLLLLSARSEAALDESARRLARRLEERPEADLADVAYTLDVGRRRFPHRRAVVAGDAAGAAAALARGDGFRGRVDGGAPPVAFLFPGQGAQRPGMAAPFVGEAVFRRELDRCRELLAPLLGEDPGPLLLAAEPGAEARLRRTALAQPCLFAV
ncbi:MAG TPA: beta-ketoacyl synthase N-terminal-like domain-containing protein, partial [Thermoanaerobaculia bacterium]